MRLKLFTLISVICAAAACTQVTSEVTESKIVDEGGTGPYTAFACMESSLPGFTIYRPQDLQAAAKKEGRLPVFIWGNGACVDSNVEYERMLTEIASHGYVIVTGGTIQEKFGDREHKGHPASHMIEGLNWIEGKAAEKGSVYYRALDLDKVAFGGHSCGGAHTLVNATDPRAKTYLMLNSGIGDMKMSGASSDNLKDFHAPVIYMSGGVTDVAHNNAELDYHRMPANVPVVWTDFTDGGHSGSFNQPYGGTCSKMALAWLDWSFKGVDNSKLFLQCDLTDFPEWTMVSKNF